MIVSEKLLKKWRTEVLIKRECWENSRPVNYEVPVWSERILRMTQDLLDYHLLRKGGNK